MRYSIKNKIVSYFVLLTLITVVVFELFSMYTVKYYYYSSTASILKSEIRYSAEQYNTNLTDFQLEDVIIQDKDQFYRRSNLQVQILNNSGVVIFDSIASSDTGQTLEYSDVEEAKKGDEGQYIGKIPYSDFKVMSVSKPLFSKGEQIGIIRLITSLEDVDRIIYGKYIVFLTFGLVVLAITISMSIIMANTIVKPIKKLIEVAEKLAEGNFSAQADVNSYDEISKLGETLNFMTDNIKEKEQLKNDFISSVSHELRTPLTAIYGWADTLAYDLEDKELLNEGLEIIKGECKRLSDMVEDLLDFSRFTSGRITLEKSLSNLTEIAIRIVKQLTPRAKSLGIDLLINYDEEPIFLEIDPNRIKQVLINLIDNALKFTKEDGVVMVNLTQKEKSIEIEVIDTGIGIDNEEISLITGKFYKGKDSNSHTGLGLSICEEIIKLHEGDMIITSKVGIGTKIKVVLPKGDIDEE